MKYLLFFLGLRTTGLTFSEALTLLDQGKEIRRAGWGYHLEKAAIRTPKGFYEYIVQDNGIYKIPTEIATNDMFAEDWELVK